MFYSSGWCILSDNCDKRWPIVQPVGSSEITVNIKRCISTSFLAPLPPTPPPLPVPQSSATCDLAIASASLTYCGGVAPVDSGPAVAEAECRQRCEAHASCRFYMFYSEGWCILSETCDQRWPIIQQPARNPTVTVNIKKCRMTQTPRTPTPPPPLLPGLRLYHQRGIA